jgi:hypothetical protein
MYQSFEDLDNLSYNQSGKPFFAIDLSNDDTVLNWMKDELQTLRAASTVRLEKAKNNYLRFKGLQYFNAVYVPRDVLEVQRKYTPQLVLPLISDAIDEKVARQMEFKPLVTVLPTHDETSDKVDAKVADRFLKHVAHEQKLDHKLQKILRNSKVTGESFIWTRWNPDLGDVVNATQKKTEDDVTVIEGVFQGDVELVNKTVHHVFYERAESWPKVNYCFVIEYDYVEALKLDYPDSADKIQEDTDANFFDYDNMESLKLKGMCKKIHFYHKKTKYLPEGFEACFTPTCLLKKGPLSYKHGELPIDRLVDIENDEELHGQSGIDKVKGLSSQVNNLINAMVKMYMLAGHAKWFVEAGSVDNQQLNNDVNIVSVKQGAQKPVLAQANPVGQSHFLFVDKFIEWFYKFSKSNSVIQGTPPAGVTAGVALQYVSESESRRLSTDVSNFNALVRSVNEKILKTCAQFYRPDDERTMMVLGKDQRWETIPLNISAIGKSYSVQIQNTSGLSDSKAQRIQQVIDLSDKYPDLLPREQVIEMTGLAQGEKAYDVASVAARAAEDENEQMMDTGVLIEPTEYEDMITHWRIHSQAMQPLGFKQKATKEVQEVMNTHLLTTETMMIDRALKNPLYMQTLQALVGFPMLADMPLQPPIDPLIGSEIPPEAPQPMQ